MKVTNKTHETVTFERTEMMGIVDLISLGFYKIKQEVLQEHLGRHYHFKLADNICDQYNRFVNLMRKEEENFRRKISLVRRHRREKVHDRQRDTRQVHKFGHLMLDQDRENTGERITIQIQRHV